MKPSTSNGYKIISQWLSSHKRRPFGFQQQTWEQIQSGNSGLVNAPTGYGKTYSVFLGALILYINNHPKDYLSKKNNGLQLIWITPLRALAKDIARAMQEVITELGMPWQVGIRNGDTAANERARQKKQMPEVLIITPESLHLLLAQKDYPALFSKLSIIAVDEWHELLGSKRGVQVELAISRLVGMNKKSVVMSHESLVKVEKLKAEKSMVDGEVLNGQRSKVKGEKSKVKSREMSGVDSELSTMNSELNILHFALCIWGISATIGNLEEAKAVLLSPLQTEGIIIRAPNQKKITIASIIPEEIEKYPWAGHLGIKLADRVLPVIHQHSTTLIFINTRGMSERWYQELLTVDPELAGILALHHGSIEQDLRLWVEDALHTGTLRAVVCTSSLDLGVDFRPVEAVVQVGSPKGVARFLQRAGRSGHQPDAESKIWFLPTHSLELLEAAALKEAMEEELIESRQPFLLCFDVLLQYLCTLAVSDGFYPDEIFEEIKSTYCYRDISLEEWNSLLHFLHSGGRALQQYDDYKKIEIMDGLYKITSRRMAMRHRMHIGTIVSDAMMKVKLMSGGFIGVIEEWFISRLQPGDVFTLAGRNLEFVMIKDMMVLVKKSSSKKSIVPSWMGGRMPLSSNLGFMLRKKLADAAAGNYSKKDCEITALEPLFELQKELSHIPASNELLIEHIETKDGFHVFVYPFEGRLVHEAMAALLAYRISLVRPISFSVAMNDYGFELLSDQPIPLDDSNVYELFSEENLLTDMQKAVNATEMTKRKFRDIAVIGGLIFQGMPGEYVKQKHLQSSASLLFSVFSEYDSGNLLLRQAFNEVMEQQMEEARLRKMLQRIQDSRVVIRFPQQLTPFCFPIKADSLRENISSEKLEDRIRKIQEQLNKL
jgi:ATP-dependent helicase Lhr and Lhr-like helicase